MDAPASPIDRRLLDRFAAIVGERHALRDPQAIAPYLVELRDRYFGRSAMVLRPGSVDEVSTILRLANETRTQIVPQGGNTGMVGGQIPDQSGAEIVLSLARLDRIRAVDPAGDTLTVEAGVTLAAARAAAEAADRLFPLSLASEGTCEIGGNLSTNAGGTAVLVYGNARELCLGIEVVLPSGEIWDGLRRLRKDNTGYDLRDLFIGAEGTLGVITAAVLKLFPRPRGAATAFVGLEGPSGALALFRIARGLAGSALTAFELFPRIGIDFLLRHLPGARDPLAGRHEWYVLFDISTLHAQAEADQLVETIFGEGFDRGLVQDGIRAESVAQAEELWRLRHAMSEVQRQEGGSIKHDVAVPVSAVPELIERASAAVAAAIPGVRPVPFGHIGDGNIHFNFSQPLGADKKAFLARWDEVNALVHGVVLDLGGTISAEHGIGVMKRDLLKRVKSPIEIDMMSRLKAAFDPNGILNPGKVL
jgi:FAD/FMN-containing dehydrogenase